MTTDHAADSAAPLFTIDPHANYTREEAAKAMQRDGFKVSVAALTTRACRGDGPRYRKLGRHTIYIGAELIAWLEARMTPPAASASEHRALRKAQKSQSEATPPKRATKPTRCSISKQSRS